MILYIFITHQGNIDNCYSRIKDMMGDDYLIVLGGERESYYDNVKRILYLDCNDLYEGLPEKVIKCFDFIINDYRFNGYSHFVKLDDDMVLIQRIDVYGDYMGVVQTTPGNRRWHIGRCPKSKWNTIEYSGEFKPWCKGGYGYMVSRDVLMKILPTNEYIDHIYEDIFMGILIDRLHIKPIQLNMEKYLVSPEHISLKLIQP